MAELDALRALRSGVRGPVDRRALRRFTANFASDSSYTHSSLFGLRLARGRERKSRSSARPLARCQVRFDIDRLEGERRKTGEVRALGRVSLNRKPGGS